MRKRRTTLAEYTKYSSTKILESMRLVDVIDIMTVDNPNVSSIIGIIKKNLKSAFYDIENSRKIISLVD